MNTLLHTATPAFPVAERLKAFAFEIAALVAVLLNPRQVIAEVETWRAQMLDAERVAARQHSGIAA